MDASIPESRRQLLPQIKAYADLLATSFDLINEAHIAPAEALTKWIVENYKKGQSLPIIVICTGNSRRSILGATMGNIAAAYYGMPEIRFYSGGTAPTAFNPRTMKALSEIGVQLEAAGREAPRGEPNTANPIVRVKWGQSYNPAMENLEFSKKYDDDANPKSGFAALMVCDEADASCPIVKNSSTRISMPYQDPKIFDGGIHEAAKYAERRDDMGRLTMAVMMQSSV